MKYNISILFNKESIIRKKSISNTLEVNIMSYNFEYYYFLKKLVTKMVILDN